MSSFRPHFSIFSPNCRADVSGLQLIKRKNPKDAAELLLHYRRHSFVGRDNAGPPVGKQASIYGDLYTATDIVRINR
jgi:hypothetical protein